MGLSKDKLVFMESSIDSSDQVGAHLLGTGNAKIDSTVDVDAKDALNVHDADVKAQLVTLNAKDFSTSAKQDEQTALLTTIDASLNAIEASAASIDTKVSTAAKQDLQTTELVAINAELDAQTVHLASLAAEDFATETTLTGIKSQTDQFTFDAGRLAVVADIRLESDVADDAADTENPFKMGSRAIDGALTAISASGDKANVVSDMYRRVYVNTAPNVGFKTTAETAGTTASELVSSPLLGRVRVMIQNLGTKDVYLGFDNTVTSANGLRIAAGSFLEMPFGEDLDIWAISSQAGQDLRIVEIA